MGELYIATQGEVYKKYGDTPVDAAALPRRAKRLAEQAKDLTTELPEGFPLKVDFGVSHTPNKALQEFGLTPEDGKRFFAEEPIEIYTVTQGTVFKDDDATGISVDAVNASASRLAQDAVALTAQASDKFPLVTDIGVSNSPNTALKDAETAAKAAEEAEKLVKDRTIDPRTNPTDQWKQYWETFGNIPRSVRQSATKPKGSIPGR